MHVTIYTDGGLSTVTGQAYAYRCICDKGRIRKAAFIKNHFDDILQVEAYAVYSAIKDCLDHWGEITLFFLRSDSAKVVRSLNEKMLTLKNVRYNNIITAILDFGIPIAADHVRSHQRNFKGKRQCLNNWCDEALKRVRRKYNK